MTTKERDPAIDRASLLSNAGMLDGRDNTTESCENKGLGGISRHETSDHYESVQAQSGSIRVTRCKDNIQYILQKRAGGGNWPWKAVAYVHSRALLPDVLQRPSLGIPKADVAVLLDQLAGVPA
ncbi:MAG: hypothetical protein AAGG47_21885 [Pseudomonadota bacterium]